MRKLGWLAVSAAVVALVVFGILLLAANLYVQSQGAQQRIRQTLTDALHAPVSLKKTTLTPWEGLRLDGIIMQTASSADVGPAGQADFMTVDSFRVQISLWRLLRQHRVVIDAILLDHPRLAWAQNPEGRWVWPEDPSAKHHRPTAAVPFQPGQGPEKPLRTGPDDAPAPAPSNRPPVPAAPSGPTFSAEAAAIPRLRVRHGLLDLLNGHHRLLGRLEEVDLDGQLRANGHAEGELRCERATLAQPALNLTHFRSAFMFDETSGLSFDGGQGQLAGGELQADYKMSTEAFGSPFSAQCQVRNVELSELLKEAGSRLHLLEGRLQGGVQVEGSSNDPGALHATGQLRLIGAEVRNFPILRLLGDLLRIKDLSHLQFKQAELDCRLDGDDLQIAPLSLISNDLRILAQGRYTAGTDQIDLHGKLFIDPAVGRQLPKFIEMNFSPCGEDAPGCRYIDFDVTGPVSRPSTNLFDRVLAGPSNGLLQNLLAPRPRKLRNKPPKPDAQIPTPTPALGGPET